MKSKDKRRKIDPAFTTRLAGYSASAAAALLSVTSAEATSGNITLTEHFTADATYLDFVRGQNVTLSFQAGPLNGVLHAYSSLKRPGDSTTVILQSVSFEGHFARLPGDNTFQTLRAFSFGEALDVPPFAIIGRAGARSIVSANSDYQSFSAVGPLAHSGARYFGFKANRNGTDYYGWLRLSIEVNDNHQLEHLAFAPNGNGFIGAFVSVNDPNFATFRAGSTVPEPGTVALSGLGLLALGAHGVRTLRHRRQQA